MHDAPVPSGSRRLGHARVAEKAQGGVVGVNDALVLDVDEQYAIKGGVDSRKCTSYCHRRDIRGMPGAVP